MWDALMGLLIEKREAESLLNALMAGAQLRGFRCRTDYYLEFSCAEDRFYKGCALPRDSALCIGGKWWFGAQKDWRTKLRRLEYDGVADSVEPVYAYILASMYWGQAPLPVLEKVLVDEDEMVLVFEGGRPVHIWNDAGHRFAWIIYRMTENAGYDRLWSLYCKAGKFVSHIPNAGYWGRDNYGQRPER